MVAMTPDDRQLTAPVAPAYERLVALATAEARKVAEPLSVLTTRMHSVGQNFAAEVAAASRRTVTEALATKRAELNRLLDDLRQRELPHGRNESPVVVHLVVRFE